MFCKKKLIFFWEFTLKIKFHDKKNKWMRLTLECSGSLLLRSSLTVKATEEYSAADERKQNRAHPTESSVHANAFSLSADCHLSLPPLVMRYMQPYAVKWVPVFTSFLFFSSPFMAIRPQPIPCSLQLLIHLIGVGCDSKPKSSLLSPLQKNDPLTRWPLSSSQKASIDWL